MPHVVLRGASPLPELIRRFAPIRARVDACVIKVEHAYVESAGTQALLPALTVDGPLRQRFYVVLAEHGDDLTVRLDSLTDPEKTEPVRLALAAVATWIVQASGGATVARSNIDDSLRRFQASRDAPAGGSPVP